MNNNIINGFNVLTKKPLDTRQAVAVLADIVNPYEGLMTFQQLDKLEYQYKDGIWVEYLIDVKKQLSDVVVNIRSFGGHTADEVGFFNFDNHDAILNAIHSLDSIGGGTVKLPRGLILTSPIDFTGCGNVRIIGDNVGYSSIMYKTDLLTTIKFINSTVVDVGFKSADTTNPYLAAPTSATYLCKSFTIENIIFDGNQKVNTALNGNYNFILKNIVVTGCLQDGIRMEDYSYPVVFENVYTYWNGRHGIYIRGKMTTCLILRNCECDFNTGYGFFIEGGASSTFYDCRAQGNTRGGLKINYNGSYIAPYFLSNLLFINFYTEGNGTLLVGDTNYEGNYGVVIGGTQSYTNMVTKPTSIEFIKGAFNQSVTGRALNITSCYGCKIGAMVSSNMVDVGLDGVYGLEFTTVGNIASNITFAGRGVTSYARHNGCIGTHYNGGLFPKRGRTQQLFFKVDSGQLVAGGSCYATSCITVNSNAIAISENGYPVMKNGCVYGMQVRKNTRTGSSGIVKITPTYINDSGFASLANNAYGAGVLSGKVSYLNLDLSTSMNANIDYDIDDLPTYNTYLVGVKLEAPANYIVGAHDGYMITLLIEY